MGGKWWQKSSTKGKPVAVATPVDMDFSSGNYAVAPHGQFNQVDAEIYRLQSMGNRSCLHKIFLMVNILAGLTGVNNIMAQIVALRFDGNKPVDVVMRLYMIGFCVLVVLIEMERTPIVRESFVLSNWFCRGIFYTFLGALAQDLFDVGYDNRYRSYYNNRYSSYGSSNYNGYSGPRMPTTEDYAEWYVWLNGAVMFLVGCVYMIMGALCLQQKLQQLRQEYSTQPQQLPQQHGGVPVSVW